MIGDEMPFAPENQPVRAALQYPESLLFFIFACLLLQQQVLIFTSLFFSSTLTFLRSFFAGYDFYDFYTAAGDWLRRANPYLRSRFCTPPPSLLVGLTFHWMKFGTAHFIFATVNVGLILVSLVLLARRLRLSTVACYLVAGIALLYYPVFFLVERGNLDALMLACIVFAVISRHDWVRAILIGLSSVLKLYGILLFVPLARESRWKTMAAALIAMGIFILPFLHLIVPFGHSIFARSSEIRGVENISPASIFFWSLGKTWIGKIVYLSFWGGTLWLAQHREKRRWDDIHLLYYLPWMAAMPFLVFPYTGVLLLPVLICRVQRSESSLDACVRNDRGNISDKLFVVGFLLVGMQSYTWTEYFGRLVHSRDLFYALNSSGMFLILLSMSVFSRGQFNATSLQVGDGKI